MAPQVDVVIVVGSPNSSNSNRLREVAANRGVPAYMVDSADELDPEWVAGKRARRRHRRRVGARGAGARGDRRGCSALGARARARARRHRRERRVPDAAGPARHARRQAAGSRSARKSVRLKPDHRIARCHCGSGFSRTTFGPREQHDERGRREQRRSRGDRGVPARLGPRAHDAFGRVERQQQREPLARARVRRARRPAAARASGSALSASQRAPGAAARAPSPTAPRARRAPTQRRRRAARANGMVRPLTRPTRTRRSRSRGPGSTSLVSTAKPIARPAVQRDRLLELELARPAR